MKAAAVRTKEEAAAPVAPRQRRTQAERREEAGRLMLEAATRIVADKGLDEFTLADVADAAGYSRGLPIHYFGSKADLIAAISGHIRQWFFAGLKARAGRRPGLANLIAGIDFYFDACRREPVMLRALQTVLAGGLNKPALVDAIAALNRDSAGAIATDIRAGIANGEIRRGIDPDTWSILVLAAVRGVIAQWLVAPAQVDVAALRADFVASLRRSFAP
ncbi:TetR/AcrR family transcriptional regulator [Vineibacter terrae]|uniref:TetR/AcrR family transcriptional regulator n=1 Tax=Vineibacter terrae TaxID=2586908 RepID=UPI002E328275|nr:TetR/AcrR family transcriptional regulator [Vineibacter terrae]HEX2890658.1 TetR/AcrR family transcriptional regulator [Vineibacter terrae]